MSESIPVKYHIAGNHMSWLILVMFISVAEKKTTSTWLLIQNLYKTEGFHALFAGMSGPFLPFSRGRISVPFLIENSHLFSSPELKAHG